MGGDHYITSTNMNHNSLKAWKIIKIFPMIPSYLVSVNQVAHQFLISSRGMMSNKPKRPALSPTAEEFMVYPFSEEEHRRGIATLKNNKIAGIYDVFVEQLNNFGTKTHSWCLQCSTTASLITRSNNMENIEDHRHIKTCERLRHLKATGQYPFSATRTDYTNY